MRGVGEIWIFFKMGGHSKVQNVFFRQFKMKQNTSLLLLGTGEVRIMIFLKKLNGEKFFFHFDRKTSLYSFSMKLQAQKPILWFLIFDEYGWKGFWCRMLLVHNINSILHSHFNSNFATDVRIKWMVFNAIGVQTNLLLQPIKFEIWHFQTSHFNVKNVEECSIYLIILKNN